MDVTIDMDDVESTFEETDRFAWARYEFRRTHTDGDRLIAREYVVEHGTEFVEEISRFYVSGDLVRERSKWWPIDPRTDSISGTHQSIETFCRERRLSDPATDFDSFFD